MFASKSKAFLALCSVVSGLYFTPMSSATAAVSLEVPPQAVTQAIAGARNLGQARLTVYGFNIYDAKLWVSDRFSAANYASESFALELKYLRNFSGPMIAERSVKEMRRLGAVTDAQAEKWLQSMNSVFPDIKKGDVLLGLHRPDGSAGFILNGKPIGEIRDVEFTRLFFGIWLSPKTSEPKMRKQLIGSAMDSASKP